MVKCLIFDVGGVLLLPGTAESFALYITRMFGRPLPDVLEAFRHNLPLIETDKMTEHEFWSLFRQELNLPINEEELHDLFYKKDHINAELVAMIRELKPKYTIALLTNNARSWLHEHLIAERIDHEVFDFIFTSFELHVRKPDPAAYTEALQIMGFEPADGVFVDNDSENTESANSMGLRSIVYESMAQLKGEFQKLQII